jgi:ectoine hydroxylase-related dioxygenase (phytanoyl-CoA dioxygenase family)
MLDRKILYYIYILTFIFIILLFIFRIFLINDNVEHNTVKYKLENQGFQVFKNVIDSTKIQEFTELCNNKNYKDLKHKIMQENKINNLIQNRLDSNYQLQDYIWIIEKSVVHTCHRDNNGDFFNAGQKHPSYTMLIYLEDMEKCLGVIPYSHKNKHSNRTNIFFDEVINLKCNAGDIIVFNANLIHVGCINKKDDNLRIQLKVSHKDDLDILNYYQDFNKVLNKDNPLPQELRKAQRNLSCMFPVISDLTQGENIRTARGSDNGIDVGGGQQWFSYLFYGNKDFYDLPNAF